MMSRTKPAGKLLWPIGLVFLGVSLIISGCERHKTAVVRDTPPVMGAKAATVDKKAAVVGQWRIEPSVIKSIIGHPSTDGAKSAYRNSALDIYADHTFTWVYPNGLIAEGRWSGKEAALELKPTNIGKQPVSQPGPVWKFTFIAAESLLMPEARFQQSELDPLMVAYIKDPKS